MTEDSALRLTSVHRLAWRHREEKTQSCRNLPIAKQQTATEPQLQEVGLRSAVQDRDLHQLIVAVARCR
jgi:hypothetical protein